MTYVHCFECPALRLLHRSNADRGKPPPTFTEFFRKAMTLS